MPCRIEGSPIWALLESLTHKIVRNNKVVAVLTSKKKGRVKCTLNTIASRLASYLSLLAAARGIFLRAAPLWWTFPEGWGTGSDSAARHSGPPSGSVLSFQPVDRSLHNPCAPVNLCPLHP